MQTILVVRNFDNKVTLIVDTVTFLMENHSAIRQLLALSLDIRVYSHVIKVFASSGGV